MAKKKRKPQRGKSKRREPPVDVPDWRVTEGKMWGLGAAGDNPVLAQAQALVYQALEEPNEGQRLRLARKALEICPDCADAWILLAEHARNHKEALELYEEGVQAGERAVGASSFAENVGHFWGVLETRPYMRAREGLANQLWTADRHAEAIEHLQEMLRLNPNDNQGVRYTLAGFLLCEDRDDDLTRLIEQFPQEGSAIWVWTKTLLAFRRQSAEAAQLLQRAIKVNKHVPEFLLGKKHLPEEQVPYYSPGQENEAIMYAGIYLRNWRGTPGAISWLRASTRKKEPQPQPKGPLVLIKQWLTRKLPQVEDIWQAGFRQPPNWIVIAGEKMRPWTVLVTSQSDDLILAHGIVEDPPSAHHLWDTLVEAMQHPAAGQPHRPTQLQVLPDERWDELKAHLEEIGMELVQAGKLDELDVAFADMHQHLVGQPRPGLLEMPGVTAAQVAGFFAAAADYYRHAPWKAVGDDSTVKVECAKFQSGPWYAIIMGQAGLTLGLALYEDLRVVHQTQQGTLGDEGHARDAVVLSLTFDEQTDLTVKDLEALQQHGWPVAGPEAYPCVFKKERGKSLRPPLAWELELLEGCLRAIPAHAERRKRDDPTPEETTVPTAQGPLTLRLSWWSEGET